MIQRLVGSAQAEDEASSACPDCGEHQTIARMSADEDMLCQHCGHSMLRSV